MRAAASGTRSGAIEQYSAESGNEEITSCGVVFAIAAACDCVPGAAGFPRWEMIVCSCALTLHKSDMSIVGACEEGCVEGEAQHNSVMLIAWRTMSSAVASC